jgi:hypothetical protein
LASQPLGPLIAGSHLGSRLLFSIVNQVMTIILRSLGALLFGTFVIGCASLLHAAATAPSPLAGTWRFDAARSTELSPWKDCTLTLSNEGDRFTIHRDFAWGRRTFTDEMTVTRGQTVTVPVEMWPDNRHLGAYISDAHRKSVHAETLDDGRILRLSSDLVLSTQQGERAVNILSDFKVNLPGDQLTVIELRSTRNRPIVYVFRRATSSAQP